MVSSEPLMREGQELDATPAVSVIIPAYNAAAYIVDALDSVLAQTFTDYEVVVVNDGSPDTPELERVLASYEGRIIYVKQENRGPSGARNSAIRIARGKYLAMLDSDDMWSPEYLFEQMRLLKADSALDVIYADAWLFGDSELAGKSFMQCSPSRGPVTFESLLRYESSIITSCAIVRRQLIIDAGLFDEKFVRCEDFDVWIRLAHQGSRIAYQKQILARHRVHGESLATDTIKMVESQIEVLKKAQRTLSLTGLQEDLIKSQLQNCEAQINLEQGKRYFVAHEYRQAAQSLKRANSFYRSHKLRFVLWGLYSAPRALHSLYVLRQNLGRAELASHATQK